MGYRQERHNEMEERKKKLWPRIKWVPAGTWHGRVRWFTDWYIMRVSICVSMVVFFFFPPISLVSFSKGINQTVLLLLLLLPLFFLLQFRGGCSSCSSSKWPLRGGNIWEIPIHHLKFYFVYFLTCFVFQIENFNTDYGK